METIDGIEVFRANENNLETIVKMVFDYYQEEKNLDPGEIGVEEGRLKKAILQKLSDSKRHFYYLFSQKGKTIGLVQFAVWDPQVAGFILIYLLPEYRGKGLGKLFIDWAVSKMKLMGVKTVKTEIRNGNKASLKLFSRYRLELSSTTYNFKI